MRRVIKVITVIVALILLISAAVLTTVAFLTADDSVTNTFTAGKVALTLDESKVDEYGVKSGNERVTDNQYRLIPGNTYVKDPTVTVLADSEASYVRIMMTIHNFNIYEACLADATSNFIGIFNGYDGNVWEYYGYTPNTADNTATIEFRYKGTPDGYSTLAGIKVGADNPLEPLFTGFTIPETITGEALNLLYGDPADPTRHFKITLEAHAIQASGFSKADDAWRAFETQMASQIASGG